jgi:hypothetical protein
MALDSLFDFRTMHWQTWIVPLAGLLCVGLTLVAGHVFLRLRRLTPQDQESQSCADPFDNGSARERRISARRAGKTVKVLISNSTAQGEPEEGVVVNRSLGGLCLELRREIPEDSVLSVRPALVSSDAPWVQVQVKHCKPRNDGAWEIGCQFVRTPSWAVLLTFS